MILYIIIAIKPFKFQIIQYLSGAGLTGENV